MGIGPVLVRGVKECSASAHGPGVQIAVEGPACDGRRCERRSVSSGEIGPGWEYYLDMLVAARDGSPEPDFDAYFPAMKPYFIEQIEQDPAR
ncbi:hypothetical protein GCM10010177_62980 [Actinomadura citrea]|nr:hypothetical protein GCM10010177_62980 [Actinomadura citrea]